MTDYKHQEFPKRVYGESLEDYVDIPNEEARPEGYLDYADFTGAAMAAPVQTDAKAVAKARRAEIRDYLDLHNVEYPKNASGEKLEALKVQLDEFLQVAEPDSTGVKDDA